MKTLFTLSSTSKATKAIPNKTQKKKGPTMRDYPTVSPYSTTRTKKSDTPDNESTISSRSNRSKNTKSSSMDASEVEQQKTVEQEKTQVDSQPTEKTQKKMTREQLIEQYNELAQKYSIALKLKSDLIDERQDTKEAIEVLYSNQMKLEKGVIPKSMQEELDEIEKEENESKQEKQENQAVAGDNNQVITGSQ